KFLGDKKTYKLIRRDVISEKINEKDISELFTQKYKIFKYMEENNLLDNTNNNDNDDNNNDNDNDDDEYIEEIVDVLDQTMDKDYFIYSELSQSFTDVNKTKNKNKNKKDISQYIPHNYHYLSNEEQMKFTDVSDMLNKEHIIENFMQKHNKIKPLKEILND